MQNHEIIVALNNNEAEVEPTVNNVGAISFLASSPNTNVVIAIPIAPASIDDPTMS